MNDDNIRDYYTPIDLYKDENRKKRKVKIIFFLCLLLIIICIVLYMYIFKYKNNQVIDNSDKVIYLYDDYKFSNELSNDSNVLFTYDCLTDECIGNIYEVDHNNKYFIVYDNNNLYYYQLSKDNKMNLANIVDNYNDNNLIINKYKLSEDYYYVVNYKNKNYFNNFYFNGHWADGDNYGLAIYISDNYLSLNDEDYAIIIDLNNKKKIIDLDSSDALNYYPTYINDLDYGYKIIGGDVYSDYIILDSNYNILGKDIHINNYTIYNEKLYFGDDNKYYIYDKDSNKIKESIEYNMIFNVTYNYISVVTKDNELEIINADTDEVVVDFGKWKSSYTAHYRISGLNYVNECSNSICLIVQDDDLDYKKIDGQDGDYGYIFYYSLDNENHGVKEEYIGGY